MTFNKLIWNIAVDSNHLINMNKVLKWHLIYIFDHFDSQSTASLVSRIANLNLIGCEGSATSSLRRFLIQVRIFIYINVCRTYTYTHTNSIIRWTFFHRYKVDPGIWIPKKAVHRCLDNFAEMVAADWLGLSRTAPGNSDILMIITLVLTNYTEENFNTWLIATLAWV